MNTLEGQTAIVTGGSRGLGLGIVEALVEHGARVTVVARDRDRLADVSRRLGVATVAGDVVDEHLAQKLVRDVRPTVLVLNAGTTPPLRPLDQLTWDDFNRAWDVDVRGGFHWLQAALRLPLPRGSRVIVASSGAALNGSPLSGSYAGAKRMLWLMAGYANDLARAHDLDIRFQAIVPQQIIGDTELGREAADAYARQRGLSVEAFLAGFGAAMPPRRVGDNVVAILTDPGYRDGQAFGMNGECGIVQLDN